MSVYQWCARIVSQVPLQQLQTMPAASPVSRATGIQHVGDVACRQQLHVARGPGGANPGNAESDSEKQRGQENQ